MSEGALAIPCIEQNQTLSFRAVVVALCSIQGFAALKVVFIEDKRETAILH
jgi:hypothetical protein